MKKEKQMKTLKKQYGNYHHTCIRTSSGPAGSGPDSAGDDSCPEVLRSGIPGRERRAGFTDEIHCNAKNGH